MTRPKLRYGWRNKRRLSREPLHLRVAEELREMIVHGQIEEGQKVPVADLADGLGVSLTPVREALKVLAEENLVELLPNRGARVRSHTVEDAHQLFEVIAGLEALAAELATASMSAAELTGLEQMHARMRGFYEARQRTEYFDLNSRIHQAIIDLAGNQVLSETHAKLSVRANRGRYIAIMDPARWAQAMDEHERLMQALGRRDAEAARAVWQAHLRHTGTAACEAMRRRIETGAAAPTADGAEVPSPEPEEHNARA